jgi:hypothetical protein
MLESCSHVQAARIEVCGTSDFIASMVVTARRRLQQLAQVRGRQLGPTHGGSHA